MKQSPFEVYTKWKHKPPGREDLLLKQLKGELRPTQAMRRTLRIVDNVKKHLPGGRILDIGCGTGDTVWALRQKGLDAYGIEPSKIAIERAVDLPEGVIRQGSVYNLEGKYDGVVMIEVIEHLQWPEMALQEIAKVARHLWLTTPDRQGTRLRSEFHLREWAHEMLTDFVEGCSPFKLVHSSINKPLESIEAHFVQVQWPR